MDESFTTPNSVLAYLCQGSAGSFKSLGKSCTRLSGGYANFVWRVELTQPYGEHRTVILKHAKSYAAVTTDVSISLNVDRMLFEREALIILQSMTKAGRAPVAVEEDDTIRNSLIRLPKVFHWDPENHVLFLEDAGDLPSIQSFLAQGPPNLERAKVAEKIGQNLGSFLSLLHTVGQSVEGEKYKDIFMNHKTAREIAAWRTIGRLKETAIKYGIHDSRIDEIAAYITKEAQESEETLNMGDFWTANVLVSTSPSGLLDALWILDWELVKYGPASSDLGQFCAESWTSAHFRDREAGSRLLQSFKTAYLATAPPTLRPLNGCGGGAEVALHLAAHVIGWTPVVGWSDDEAKVEKTLRPMFDHILAAWDALKNNKDVEWWIAP